MRRQRTQIPEFAQACCTRVLRRSSDKRDGVRRAHAARADSGLRNAPPLPRSGPPPLVPSTMECRLRWHSIVDGTSGGGSDLGKGGVNSSHFVISYAVFCL